MSWAMDTVAGRNGAFRNLLRTVEHTLHERATSLWEALPDPKSQSASAIAAHYDFSAAGEGALRELLYLMIAEHAAYLQNIRAEHGGYYEATDSGQAMLIDNREQMAEHLAARRAEARFMLHEPPGTFDDLEETWMHLKDQQR